MKSLLLVGLLLVTPVRAASLLDSTLRWFDEHHHRALETLHSGSDAERAPIINSIGLVISRADGALMFEIEPYVYEVIMARPALFLEWFQNRPQEFSTLLKISKESYFLAETDAEAIELEARRLRMIDSLKAVPAAAGAEALQAALEGAQVRIID